MVKRIKTTTREFLVFATKDQLVSYACGLWEKKSKSAIEDHGYFVVALSGGKTPIKFYQALAKQINFAVWENTHLFQVDERFVPDIHVDSNYKSLFENLIAPSKIPLKNFHKINTNLNYLQSVKDYDQQLTSFFRIANNQYPKFDLVVLGVGVDGHTASIFPNKREQIDAKELVVLTESLSAKHMRVSLTLSIVNQARNIVFLITGKDKAKIVQKIREENDSCLPAALVRPKDGSLVFLLDSDAAARIGD